MLNAMSKEISWARTDNQYADSLEQGKSPASKKKEIFDKSWRLPSCPLFPSVHHQQAISQKAGSIELAP
jgi:hypothetical protein